MRLLLAEDDHTLLTSLKKDLQSAGYAVYDIAVLDLGLPQRNGIDVLKNWRAEGNLLPVLVLTGRNAWHERVDGFKAGADDYLGKPFHTEELLVRLSALLHRSRQKPGGALNVAGLQLDEKSQTVITDDGNSHKLTGIEFRLLRYFLLNTNQVLSKSQLTEHVYDFDSDKDSNVIEVYVKRLRQLLGKERIETRRGQGYVFRELP